MNRPSMGLLGANNEPLHGYSLSTCKDYVQDTLYARRATIPTTEWFNLGVQGPSNAEFSQILGVLNNWEECLQFPQTTLVARHPMALRFHRSWAETPTLSSAFTTLVRNADGIDLGDPEGWLRRNNLSYDTYRSRLVIPRLLALRYGWRPSPSNWEELPTVGIHSGWGICDHKEPLKAAMTYLPEAYQKELDNREW